MNRKLIPILIANLFAAPAVLAADATFLGMKWDGEVSLGGVGTIVNSPNRDVQPQPIAGSPGGPATQDKAKANEYRDLYSTGGGTGAVSGGFDLRGRGDQFWANAFGENLNRHDQYLNLQGGMYDTFKYRVYDDRMVHNLSWQLLTPFSGVGGTNLTLPAGATGLPGGTDVNPYNWNMYDAALKKENIGGFFEWSKNSPWYFRADANQVTTQGIKDASSSFTMSSGNGSIDLPMPVNYKTQNYSLETGYADKVKLVNVNFSQSFFTNDIAAMSWQDARWNNLMVTQAQASDSTLSKLGINGTWRKLPLNSTAMGRISYSELRTSRSLNGPGLSNIVAGAAGAGAYTSTNPSPDQFDGKIVNSNGNLAVSSNPYQNLDTRVFVNWYDRSNRSPEVTYTPFGDSGARYVSYRKENYGADVGYRINPAHKLSGGANQTDIRRVSMVSPIQEPGKTTDRSYWAEYKNSAIEDLTARLKYEYATRTAGDWDNSIYGPGSAGLARNPLWGQPLDTKNFVQNRVGFSLDANPIPLLDIGFQTRYKITDYKGGQYGINSDHRQEFDASISYGDASKWRITAFADYEMVRYVDYSFVGNIGNGSIGSATSFNIQSNTRNANSMFGLAADWAATPKFKTTASYIYLRTNGGVDFITNAGAQTNGVFTQSGIYAGSIQPYTTDNTTKHSITLKGKYEVDKNWSVTGAYAFEKYQYRDDQFNGYGGTYAYVAPLTATMAPSFSGAYQNPNYIAQVLRVMVNYKF